MFPDLSSNKLYVQVSGLLIGFNWIQLGDPPILTEMLWRSAFLVHDIFFDRSLPFKTHFEQLQNLMPSMGFDLRKTEPYLFSYCPILRYSESIAFICMHINRLAVPKMMTWKTDHHKLLLLKQSHHDCSQSFACFGVLFYKPIRNKSVINSLMWYPCETALCDLPLTQVALWQLPVTYFSYMLVRPAFILWHSSLF